MRDFQITRRRTSRLVIAVSAVLAASTVSCSPHPRLARLERSYWLHASLAAKPHRGYWSPAAPKSEAPAEREVAAAAGLLAGPCAANRLYLIYHKEINGDEARQAFCDWRRHTPADIEIVPTLVLRMYDKATTAVFAPGELRSLCAFFRREIRAKRLGVFDVYPNREQGDGLAVLAEAFPGRLTRVGIQPDEVLRPPLTEAVQDTWGGFCHGKTNADWLDAGFGADTLRTWIDIRNRSPHKTAWNLIVVAWDYAPTQRGEYPGYDDSKRNMPLPAGRNILAAREILRLADPARFAGFSSDLSILQANSITAAHDGPDGAFYRSLKRGEIYRGYYGEAFAEVAAIYRGLRAGRLIESPGAMAMFPPARQHAR